MTKPRGSLGVLEEVSVRLAGLAGSCPPPLPEPACVAVFAADHGVHAQGVSPWPQEVTAQMVANFLAGGAVVNAFAAQAGAEVTVVDVGVAAPLDPVPGPAAPQDRAGHRGLHRRARDDPRAGHGRADDRHRDRPRPGRGGQPVPDHRRHGHRQHHRVGRADLRLHRRRPGRGRPAAAPGSTRPPTRGRSTSSAAAWPGTGPIRPTRWASWRRSAASSTPPWPGSSWAPPRCASR